MTGFVLLVGGQKSGKSRAAARLATLADAPVTVVAPARAADGDAEFAARIDRHRADRPDRWTTLETFDVAAAIEAAEPTATVVVDALDTWLLDRMAAHHLTDDDVLAPDDRRTGEEAVLDEVAAIADAIDARRATALTVVVAGQPGMGLIGASPFTRRYVDLHGLAVTRLGEVADRVALVLAGRLLDTTPLPCDAP